MWSGGWPYPKGRNSRLQQLFQQASQTVENHNHLPHIDLPHNLIISPYYSCVPWILESTAHAKETMHEGSLSLHKNQPKMPHYRRLPSLST